MIIVYFILAAAIVGLNILVSNDIGSMVSTILSADIGFISSMNLLNLIAIVVFLATISCMVMKFAKNDVGVRFEDFLIVSTIVMAAMFFYGIFIFGDGVSFVMFLLGSFLNTGITLIIYSLIGIGINKIISKSYGYGLAITVLCIGIMFVTRLVI